MRNLTSSQKRTLAHAADSASKPISGTYYRIRSVDERDNRGRALYWNNLAGWVDFTAADTFTAYERARGFVLPRGGEWVEVAR